MNTTDCSAVVDEGSAAQPELDGTLGQRFRLQPAVRQCSLKVMKHFCILPHFLCFEFET